MQFFFIPQAQKPQQRTHFGAVENEAAATRDFKNTSSEDFLHCYEEWQQRWNRCI
jgi:hypothetical protein